MMLLTHRVTPPIGEKRVTLRNLDWQAYQQLRSLLEGHTHARLTYDRGTLEITTPLEEHEFAGVMFALFIRILVTEMSLKLKSMGSTTLEREDLARGAEPDKGFYIQNQPLVAGRNVDLSTDPPPDLIVEVDITNTDIDKNKLYAAIGVPEFWRFNGEEWRVYQLQNGNYVERDRSPTFPIVEKPDLYRFLQECQHDEIQAEFNFRAWVRQQLAQ
jgi:Uma2 family endonuclease